jgi:hypothetical protein
MSHLVIDFDPVNRNVADVSQTSTGSLAFVRSLRRGPTTLVAAEVNTEDLLEIVFDAFITIAATNSTEGVRLLDDANP